MKQLSPPHTSLISTGRRLVASALAIAFTIAAASANASELDTMLENRNAIRKLGITVQGEAKDLGGIEATRFCERLVKAIAARTFLEPSCVKTAAVNPTVDGVYFLKIESGNVKARLVHSQSKLKLDQWERQAGKDLNTILVDEIAFRIPYRGFVTAVVDKVVTLNLGSKHGIKIGQRLQIFNFSKAAYDSQQNPTGEVTIEKVLSENESQARTTSMFSQISIFDKISYNEPVGTPMQATTRVSATPWISVGVEMATFNITSNLPEYSNRTYETSLGAFAHVAAGYDRFSAAFTGADLSSSEYNVLYTYAQAQYEVFYFGGKTEQDRITAYAFSLGAFADNYSPSGKSGRTSNKVQQYTYGIVSDIRKQKVHSNQLKTYWGVSIHYPIRAKDQDTTPALTSFGAMPYLGARYDLNRSWGFETILNAGVRFIRYSGFSGLTQTQAGAQVNLLHYF